MRAWSSFSSRKIVDISSTRLRRELSQGQGRAYLDPAVYGYILRRGLYGVPADPLRLSLEKAQRVHHLASFSGLFQR